MPNKSPYEILDLIPGCFDKRQADNAYARACDEIRSVHPSGEMTDARLRRIEKAYNQLLCTLPADANDQSGTKPVLSREEVRTLEKKLAHCTAQYYRFSSLTAHAEQTIRQAGMEYRQAAGGLRGVFGRYVPTGERQRALQRLHTLTAGFSNRTVIRTGASLQSLRQDLDRLSRPGEPSDWTARKPGNLASRIDEFHADMLHKIALFMEAREVLSGRRPQMFLNLDSADEMRGTLRCVVTHDRAEPTSPGTTEKKTPNLRHIQTFGGP